MILIRILFFFFSYVCVTLCSSAANQGWYNSFSAKVVLQPLAPPAAFATGQGMKTNRMKVSLCNRSSNMVKVIAFRWLIIIHITYTFHLLTLSGDVTRISFWCFDIDQIQLEACETVAWRRCEALFKQWPVIICVWFFGLLSSCTQCIQKLIRSDAIFTWADLNNWWNVNSSSKYDLSIPVSFSLVVSMDWVL